MGEKTLQSRIIEAQGNMANPKMDSVNPRFGSKYASLAAVEAAVRQPLLDAGLAYRQEITSDGWLALIVSDEQSEMTVARFPVTLSKDAQGRGSELTYGRRYNLLAAFGLVGDEDDDGNAATDAAKAEKPQRDYSRMTEAKKRWAALKGITEAQAGNEIVQAYGNPAAMSEKDYERFLSTVEAAVVGMEREYAGKG